MKGATLIAIGAAFATGLGLGFLLAQRDEAPARSGVRTAAPAPPQEPMPRREAASPEAFLESIPLPRIPEGDGRITGRVRSDAGEPVAGVKIDARCQAGPGGGADWPTEPTEQLLRLAESVKWNAALHRSATTSADGTFVLHRVPDLAYGIGATLPGWRIRLVSRDGAQSVKAGMDVEFVAERVVDVRVTLLFPDGVAPTRATVMAKQGENSSRWGDRNGVAEFALKPGEWELRATAGEEEELASEPERVTLAGGSTEVTLRLRGRPGIMGRIVIGWGKLVGNPEVRCVAIGAGAEPALSLLDAEGPRVRVSSEGERFSVVDLAPGRYLVGVYLARSGPGESPAETEVVDVADSLVVRDLVVPEPPRSSYAIVHVLGPTGVPVEDLAFMGGFRGGRVTWGGPIAVLKRSDGSYFALHHDISAQVDGNSTAGEHSITIDSREYGSRRIAYTRGPADEFRIRYAPRATLVVTLAGFRATPPQSELSMLLRAPLSPEERSKTARTYRGNRKIPDGRGRFTMEPTESGSYEIVIFHSRGPGLGAVVATVAVTLRPGENHLELPVPTMLPLKVRTGGKAGVQVQLQPAGGDAEWFLAYQKSDASGIAEFPALAPGAYTVRAGGSDPVTVHVNGPTEVAVDG